MAFYAYEGIGYNYKIDFMMNGIRSATLNGLHVIRSS